MGLKFIGRFISLSTPSSARLNAGQRRPIKTETPGNPTELSRRPFETSSGASHAFRSDNRVLAKRRKSIRNYSAARVFVYADNARSAAFIYTGFVYNFIVRQSHKYTHVCFRDSASKKFSAKEKHLSSVSNQEGVRSFTEKLLVHFSYRHVRSPRPASNSAPSSPRGVSIATPVVRQSAPNSYHMRHLPREKPRNIDLAATQCTR